MQKVLERIKKYDKKDVILFLSVLILSFVIATLYFYTKRVFMTDEQDSFSLSNYFNGFLSGWFIFDPHGWYEKGFFNVYGVTDNAFNFSETAKNVYWDEHPPLWFWIMHFISSVFKNRFSVWFSYIINIPCFVVNCILVYCIVKKVSNNSYLSSLSMLVYSLNSLVLTKFIFIRSYQLESTLLLVFAFLGIRIVKEEGSFVANNILISIVFMLGGLNHYPFYVESFSLCVCFAVYLLIYKKYKILFVALFELIFAFLVNAFIFFPGIFRHMGVNHGQHAIEQFSHLNINWDVFKGCIDVSWGGKLSFYIGIFLLIASLYKYNKGNKNFIVPILFLFSYYIAYTIIAYTIDFPSDSHLMPIQLLSIVGVCSSVSMLFNKQIGVLVLSGFIILNIDLSQIYKNFNLIPSWEFAEEHQDEVALVYYNEDELKYYPYDCYNIMQSLFADLRWYSAVELGSQYDEDFTYSDKRDCVLYVKKTFDQKEALEHIDNKVLQKNKYEIRKTNIQTSYYDVYQVIIVDK